MTRRTARHDTTRRAPVRSQRCVWYALHQPYVIFCHLITQSLIAFISLSQSGVPLILLLPWPTPTAALTRPALLGRPYTSPPHGIYPAPLMSLSAGEKSSDSTSGCTSRGSGPTPRTSPLCPVPHATIPLSPWHARVVSSSAVRASITISPTIPRQYWALSAEHFITLGIHDLNC